MRAKVSAVLALSVAASIVLGTPNPERLGPRDAIPTDPESFTGPITPITSKPASTYILKFPTLSPELSSLLSEEASLLTLPSSILAALSTVAPSGLNVADGCVLGGSKMPDWFGKLPSSVQSYLTSYESGVKSWYTAHSSQLGVLSSYVASLSAADVSYLGKTSGQPVGPTGSVCSFLAVQTTGISYPTQTSTSKKNMAAKPTGAVAAGLAGVVGVLGVVAAL
ncbi:MAG: hypothetical protein M1839_001391 [Geoglossum umbratile]|nr:MAG: hypothetical protein M1839_001391 [Geoglossum umbratile]